MAPADWAALGLVVLFALALIGALLVTRRRWGPLDELNELWVEDAAGLRAGSRIWVNGEPVEVVSRRGSCLVVRPTKERRR